MVVAFTPAGTMEAFFGEASALAGMGAADEIAALFGRHGMTVTGPPLDPGNAPQDEPAAPPNER